MNSTHDDSTLHVSPAGREGGGVDAIVVDIKKELRANMNGVASAAMRQTPDYRVNFGVELPRIHSIASEFASDHALAQRLWNESVRECKILATILMPTDTFYSEVADIWVESIRTVEIAQMFCINLMRRLPYSCDKAFEWMASSDDIKQICSYLVICQLLRSNQFNDRAIDEFLDQALVALQSDNAQVRISAWKAIEQYASKGRESANVVCSAMRDFGFDREATLRCHIDMIMEVYM